MSDTLFNISILSNILERNNVESNQTNCYLFLLFFLERSQLISNIVRIINPLIKNSFSIGIKYCILREENYNKIIKKIKEYKNEFDKNELINELIRFIKNTIDEKKVELIKMDTSPEKISFLFNSFSSLKTLIENIDCLGVDENEIYEYLQNMNELNEINKIRSIMQDELLNIENEWKEYNKNSEIYLLLKNWL